MTSKKRNDLFNHFVLESTFDYRAEDRRMVLGVEPTQSEDIYGVPFCFETMWVVYSVNRRTGASDPWFRLFAADRYAAFIPTYDGETI